MVKLNTEYSFSIAASSCRLFYNFFHIATTHRLIMFCINMWQWCHCNTCFKIPCCAILAKEKQCCCRLQNTALANLPVLCVLIVFKLVPRFLDPACFQMPPNTNFGRTQLCKMPALPPHVDLLADATLHFAVIHQQCCHHDGAINQLYAKGGSWPWAILTLIAFYFFPLSIAT